VKVRGKTVRFVNTHLEAFSVAVRNQQARELAVALAGSADPVVLVGDLNSAPDDSAGAYGTFAAAGYVDAWVVAHGPEGGFTAGQTELLDNVPSKLDHRVDYVLYQPRGVEAVAAEVIGEELEDRTAAGLWPSDHAGVVATLHLAHP
jgi:endonuclease/exonuclease/phosphatase family metal-dependent hydrolase